MIRATKSPDVPDDAGSKRSVPGPRDPSLPRRRDVVMSRFAIGRM